MRLAFILLFMVPLYLFVGIVSAEDGLKTKYTNLNLHVCSSGIRGNACDPASKQVTGSANRRVQSLPENARVGMDYPSHVESMIATNFILPGGSYNNLSAVIIIKVSRDGNVRSNNFEKRSGNPYFDKAAMQAISSAAPFGPPPRELTDTALRVTFHP